MTSLYILFYFLIWKFPIYGQISRHSSQSFWICLQSYYCFIFLLRANFIKLSIKHKHKCLPVVIFVIRCILLTLYVKQYSNKISWYCCSFKSIFCYSTNGALAVLQLYSVSLSVSLLTWYLLMIFNLKPDILSLTSKFKQISVPLQVM